MKVKSLGATDSFPLFEFAMYRVMMRMSYQTTQINGLPDSISITYAY